MFADENKRISYDEFVHINENVTSEMFLSIITLLQTNLPCAKNFFRYKSNYESVATDDGDAQPKGTTRKIASPKVGTKLSPVSQFVANRGLNPNPMSQKHLLKYAPKKSAAAESMKSSSTMKGPQSDDSEDDDDRDYSRFQSKRALQDVKKRRE